MPRQADPVVDNRVRWDPADVRGHVESHFLRANSPDGRRALWIKHTLLAPVGQPASAVAEVWAVAFERGRAKVAVKSTTPAAAARFAGSPFRVEAAEAVLATGEARGQVQSGGHRIRWDVRFDPRGGSHHPFPLQRMYEAPFPKSKTLTPYPDTVFEGTAEVDGERWEVAGWPGMQGHNWGRSHAEAYAWAHCNSWDSEVEGSAWFEGLSGRVRVGPLLTPWLSVAAVHLDGETVRFDGLRAMTSRSVDVGWYRWRASFAQGTDRLQVDIAADAEDIAGLRYENPDRAMTHCLNSKLARGTVTLSRAGRPQRVLRSDRLALELGTKDLDHGIPMLV